MNYSELLQLAKGWGNFVSDRINIWRLQKNLVRTVEASGVIPNKSFKVHVIDPIRNPNVFYAFYFQNSDLLLITGCTRTKIKANRRK